MLSRICLSRHFWALLSPPPLLLVPTRSVCSVRGWGAHTRSASGPCLKALVTKCVPRSSVSRLGNGRIFPPLLNIGNKRTGTFEKKKRIAKRTKGEGVPFVLLESRILGSPKDSTTDLTSRGSLNCPKPSNCSVCLALKAVLKRHGRRPFHSNSFSTGASVVAKVFQS